MPFQRQMTEAGTEGGIEESNFMWNPRGCVVCYKLCTEKVLTPCVCTEGMLTVHKDCFIRHFQQNKKSCPKCYKNIAYTMSAEHLYHVAIPTIYLFISLGLYGTVLYKRNFVPIDMVLILSNCTINLMLYMVCTYLYIAKVTFYEKMMSRFDDYKSNSFIYIYIYTLSVIILILTLVDTFVSYLTFSMLFIISLYCTAGYMITNYVLYEHIFKNYIQLTSFLWYGLTAIIISSVNGSNVKFLIPILVCGFINRFKFIHKYSKSSKVYTIIYTLSSCSLPVLTYYCSNDISNMYFYIPYLVLVFI